MTGGETPPLPQEFLFYRWWNMREGKPLPYRWNERPLPQLTPYGEIADGWIQKIPEKYPESSVDCYVIMPNHIHILLSIVKDDGRGNPSPTVDAVVGWLKYQATKEINKLQGSAGDKIFQRSFFDHIVRNRDDYNEICKYIYENPVRWYYDKLYSEE